MPNKNEELKSAVIKIYDDLELSKVTNTRHYSYNMALQDFRDKILSLLDKQSGPEWVSVEEVKRHFPTVLSRAKKPFNSIHGGSVDKNYDNALKWFNNINSEPQTEPNPGAGECGEDEGIYEKCHKNKGSDGLVCETGSYYCLEICEDYDCEHNGEFKPQVNGMSETGTNEVSLSTEKDGIDENISSM